MDDRARRCPVVRSNVSVCARSAEATVSLELQSSTGAGGPKRITGCRGFLRDKKSKLAFAVHDSIVIDLDHNERNLLPQIRELFADTRLGKFKVGVKIGKNMGKLREFAW